MNSVHQSWNTNEFPPFAPFGVLKLNPECDPVVEIKTHENVNGRSIAQNRVERRMSGDRSPGVIQRSPDFGPQLLGQSPPLTSLGSVHSNPAHMLSLFGPSPLLQSSPSPSTYIPTPPPYIMSSSAPAYGGESIFPWSMSSSAAESTSDLHSMMDERILAAARDMSHDTDASFNSSNGMSYDDGGAYSNGGGFVRHPSSSSADSSQFDDLFLSMGGFELDDSDSSPANNVMGGGEMGGGNGQHEHPSRSVLVRNIAPNVEDAELMTLFEQFGSVRSLYTHLKHRGFVIALFNDIRHAQAAAWHLQGRVVRRRALDIHFSVPKSLKEQMSDRDRELFHGTVVVFNLDPSTTNDDLHRLFSQSGEVKEIRETPNKKHHKFVEFYDIRAAEIALRTLNKTELRGKRIKIEASRPGCSNGRAGDDFEPMYMQQTQQQHQNGALSRQGQTTPTLSDSSDGTTPPLLQEMLSPSFLRSMSNDTRQAQNSGTQRLGAWANPLHLGNRISVSAPAEGSGFAMRHAHSNSMLDDSSSRTTNAMSRDRRSRDKSSDSHSFGLDIEAVRSGHETRSTLMIKNIPNKYSQRMLLAAVDKVVPPGSYDFFYLPIDFKNKCNVGYAFVNFTSAANIPAFFNAFHRHAWEKFNSDKICEVTFARIQGKAALIQHFQNSSLMAEERKCRPLIFHSDGVHKGEQEPFPIGPNARRRLSSERRIDDRSDHRGDRGGISDRGDRGDRPVDRGHRSRSSSGPGGTPPICPMPTPRQ